MRTLILNISKFMQAPKFRNSFIQAIQETILLYWMWREQDLPKHLYQTTWRHILQYRNLIFLCTSASLKFCTKHWSISYSVCLRFEGDAIEAHLITAINRHPGTESHTHIVICRNFNSSYSYIRKDKNIWQLMLPRSIFLHIFSRHADRTILWNIASMNCDRSSVFLRTVIVLQIWFWKV